MNRVILFDCDGVLNGHEWCHIGGLRIRQDCAACFNSLVQRGLAKCVLISSWRNKVHRERLTIRGMEWVFETHGIKMELVDVLPPGADTVQVRSELVNQWITTNKPDTFVVLDDLALMVPNLIRPNPALGLQPYQVTDALRILRPDEDW